MTNTERPQVAFYYPGWIWSEDAWVKNLILFFDGVALLVPRYMEDRPRQVESVMASPMYERGLLKILEPEDFVDRGATEELAEAITELLASDAFADLDTEGTAFHELSRSRMGFYGDHELAKMIFDELKERDLARESEDGVSVPLHPVVRCTILVLLAQILRPQGEAIGLELCPATDRPELVDALVEILSLPTAPSAGRVVQSDLATVGVDLSLVPVDEVLSFREEHLDQHRAYARAVRAFVHDLSLMSEQRREAAFDDREAELADLANDLRRRALKAWKKPASFGLSIAGAAWTITSDPIGSLFGVGAAILGAERRSDEGGAFSFLFSARRELY